jgi:hypothetical protein
MDAKTKASPRGPENSTNNLERAKKLIRLASGSGDFAIYNPAKGEFVEPFKKSA